MKETTSEMTPSGPSVNAVDLTIHGTGDLAFDTLSATAVSPGTARRHGVADSIRGFGSLDPGSNPGASASSQPLGHGVVESISVCETFDPGSNPGAPATSTHGGAKTQHRSETYEQRT